MKKINEIVEEATNRVLAAMQSDTASLADLSKALDSIVAAYKATGKDAKPSDTPFTELRDKIRAVE
jgi:hypothetical protein